MLIPKGSIIYQNVFAMHRDPNVYSNPYNFDPDRYIPKSESGRGEPFPVGNFGFGRRYVIFKEYTASHKRFTSAVDKTWVLGCVRDSTWPTTQSLLSWLQYYPRSILTGQLDHRETQLRLNQGGQR